MNLDQHKFLMDKSIQYNTGFKYGVALSLETAKYMSNVISDMTNVSVTEVVGRSTIDGTFTGQQVRDFGVAMLKMFADAGAEGMSRNA